MSDTRPGEEAAWAEVTARWQEEEAHREYLSRRWVVGWALTHFPRAGAP
jgi:hypothetical protein